VEVKTVMCWKLLSLWSRGSYSSQRRGLAGEGGLPAAAFWMLASGSLLGSTCALCGALRWGGKIWAWLKGRKRLL
jgi:hypothetical protein